MLINKKVDFVKTLTRQHYRSLSAKFINLINNNELLQKRQKQITIHQIQKTYDLKLTKSAKLEEINPKSKESKKQK